MKYDVSQVTVGSKWALVDRLVDRVATFPTAFFYKTVKCITANGVVFWLNGGFDLLSSVLDGDYVTLVEDEPKPAPNTAADVVVGSRWVYERGGKFIVATPFEIKSLDGRYARYQYDKNSLEFASEIFLIARDCRRLPPVEKPDETTALKARIVELEKKLDNSALDLASSKARIAKLEKTNELYVIELYVRATDAAAAKRDQSAKAAIANARAEGVKEGRAAAYSDVECHVWKQRCS